MAKVKTGILGAFRGKCGPIVGASCFGVDYVKEYTIPGNPRTAPQVYQRDLFSFVRMLAGAFLTTLVQTYWKQYADRKSAYNAFIGSNAILQDDYATGGPTFSADYSKVKMTKGSLEKLASLSSFTYDSGTGNAIATWTDTVKGNGQATDKVIVCIWDKENSVAYFSAAKTREDLTETISLPTGLTVTNLEGYVGVAQGSAIPYLTGDSIYQQLTAA